MKIHKIKKAKFSDFFKINHADYEKIASHFVENYLERRKKLPTVGEIVLAMLESKSINTEKIDHDYLKSIAMSVVNQWGNKLVGV